MKNNKTNDNDYYTGSTVSEVFHTITTMHDDIENYPTHTTTTPQLKESQNILISLNFTHYQTQRELCPQIQHIIIPIKQNEDKISKIIQNETNTISQNNEITLLLLQYTKNIQSLLLHSITPDSKEYLQLLKEHPNITKLLDQPTTKQ